MLRLIYHLSASKFASLKEGFFAGFAEQLDQSEQVVPPASRTVPQAEDTASRLLLPDFPRMARSFWLLLVRSFASRSGQSCESAGAGSVRLQQPRRAARQHMQPQAISKARIGILPKYRCLAGRLGGADKPCRAGPSVVISPSCKAALELC